MQGGSGGRERVDRLANETENLQTQYLEATAQGRSVQSRLTSLGVATGADAARGPGVVVRADDGPPLADGENEIIDLDLQKLVNGFWLAGAEAISINGERLTALTAGAYVGGDLTYRLGNQVDRHAFRGTSKKWKALDVGDVPEGQLVKAMHGSEPIVLLRTGDEIRAIHATCAHAGGPLHEGTLVDGCVQCPWHGSRFRLADGGVVQGPAVYDQPAYEVRRTPDGGLEARAAERG